VGRNLTRASQYDGGMTAARRRLCIRFALLAALGLVSTLVIAWAVAAVRDIPMYPRTTIGAFERWRIPWHAGRVDRGGVSDLWWTDLRVDFPGEAEPAVRESRRLNAEHAANKPGIRIENRRPGWGTFDRSSPPPAAFGSGSDTAFGWPLPCLWYQVVGVSGRDSEGSPTIDQERLVGGIALRGEPSCRIRGFHALPLLPIWPALVANTAFFAALWWLIFFVPGVIRRWLRARRGRCAGCGYDLVATPPSVPCPECGRVRDAEHAAVLSPPQAS
jgi:hypothetical protein